jgi:hypothetical protein
MNDRDFVKAFEACTIAKTDFHHADHVRLAWIYLREGSLIEAIARFSMSLQRFAAHHGVPGLYHETITWAYLLLIHERMQREDSPQDWPAFRESNADLCITRPSILDCYYTPATLKSATARRTFVLPDAFAATKRTGPGDAAPDCDTLNTQADS